VVAGPSYESDDTLADPHVKTHDMILEVPDDAPTGGACLHGNPIEIQGSSEGPATNRPLVGDHADGILQGDLALVEGEIATLRADGVIR
jgi:crotonobetainyl-CoA:carnitine CoA-transferase CaiB-like acyl-CoA transferase